jgi:hypothetical protein
MAFISNYYSCIHVSLEIALISLLYFDTNQRNVISRGNQVVAATGYGLSFRVIQVAAKSRIFTSAYRPDRIWGPSNSYPMLTEDYFLTGKASTNHSPPTNAEVKKA